MKRLFTPDRIELKSLYVKGVTKHPPEIDLVFEQEGAVYAVEVKATRSPGPRDPQHLKRFANNTDRPVKAFLFYMGDRYETVDGVRLVPIAALYRGA